MFCLKAGVSSDSPCASVHEPIEELQGYVLKVINLMSKVLVDRVADIKSDIELEIPAVERKIAEAHRLLRKLQVGKLDLYEDYRQEKITRDKFITTQKKRQQEGDQINASLILLEAELEMLKKKAERVKALEADAKEAEMLPCYRPDVIRRLVKCVRVYGAGWIEIDLLANDDFITEILESAVSNVG